MEGINYRFGWKQAYVNHVVRSAVLVCMLFFSSLSQAKILLLLSSDVSYYQETAQSLQIAASEQGTPTSNFTVVTIEEARRNKSFTKTYELIVAIGTSAAYEALKEDEKTPLLNIFTPKNAFEALELSMERKTQRPISAIYLDQPLSRLIALGCLLKPGAKTFGTIFGPISQEVQSEALALTQKNGLHLKHNLLSQDDNPVAILKPVVSESDLFIAIPDHAILNRAIAKWILYLSFQQKVPVIGFSKAYTNAGALASVYSSPEGVGKHAGELISSWLKQDDDSIWKPQYPRYYTLSTNPAVARSLGIALPSESELYEKFHQQEKLKP
jgi:putative ABC transport system substrate-binding protein